MKKAIIIGATTGIGKTLAEIFIQNGYSVGITGRREDLLLSFQQQYPDKIYYRKMDVHDLSGIESLCNELVNQLGGLERSLIPIHDLLKR
jgi:NADP-dependent 3-hydroxy acid dehydrogenase YdfG